MALRLLFVGVVISLAVDLPDRGATPTTSSWRTGRSWLDARMMAPASPRGLVVVAEPCSQEPEIASVPADLTDPVVVNAPQSRVDEVVAIAPEIPSSETVPAVPSSWNLSQIKSRLIAAVEPIREALNRLPEAAPEIVEPILPVESVEIAEVEIPEEAAVVEDDSVPSQGILADIAPVTIAEPVVVIDSALAALETDADAVFSSVVGQMAQSFAADVPAPAVAEPAPLIADVVIPEAPAIAADQIHLDDEPILVEAEDVEAPSLADELNRMAEGLEPIALPQPAEVVQAPSDPVDSPEVEDRENRLAHAVQLTGQAVQAWASLLVQRPAVISVQR